MKVVVFGATGMVGQGVLRECLLDPAVTEVVALVRGGTGQHHAKLREVRQTDFFAYEPGLFTGAGACLFCLGVSSVGMSQDDYRRVTLDLTLAAARAFATDAPGARFVYVSGAGTDGRAAWAKVKKATEEGVAALDLEAYAVRPGIIRPGRGVRSKTRLYRVGYAVAGPLLSVLRRVSPRLVITSEELGRAMVRIALHGAPRRVLEMADLTALGRR
ncbi:MAG TPA: epimerase [Pseudonocardiaceae bacterium]